MKKIMLALAALSMTATPAFADGYRGREYHENRGVSTGGAIAISLGALILGGALANSNRQRQPRYDDPRYEPQYQAQLVCQNEYMRDYNGNYILDRYGRAIYTQRCWYQ